MAIIINTSQKRISNYTNKFIVFRVEKTMVQLNIWHLDFLHSRWLPLMKVPQHYIPLRTTYRIYQHLFRLFQKKKPVSDAIRFSSFEKQSEIYLVVDSRSTALKIFNQFITSNYLSKPFASHFSQTRNLRFTKQLLCLVPLPLPKLSIFL